MESKNNFLVKVHRLVYKLFARHWWPFWSNIRFKKAIRYDRTLEKEDIVMNLTDIRSQVKKLYNKFTWTRDGIDQLGDAITPPPQNYYQYLSGELRDDCDGFHSLVYHCLYNSGFECYLLSVIALGGGHCVLLFKSKNDKWYVNDYNDIYGGFDTAAEVVEHYNKIYEINYKPKSEVVANDIFSYDYNKGKFSLDKIKKL